MQWRGRIPSRLQSRGAQLQEELRGVDDVGGVGGERQPHQARWPEPALPQRQEVGRVQRQHQHAEHVLPKEWRGKQPDVVDVFFPDRARHHDRVQDERFDHDRQRGRGETVARGQIPQDQDKADQEDEELQGGQDRLHKGPDRGVSTAALFGRVQRGRVGLPHSSRDRKPRRRKQFRSEPTLWAIYSAGQEVSIKTDIKSN